MTYYGLPKPATVKGWAERTPPGFQFIVKVNQQSTHQRDNEANEVGELLDLLSPLRADNGSSLHGLLAQFPASFHANAENEHYLALLARWRDEIPLFVEFRHTSWDTDRAVTLCDELGVHWVACDLPPIRSLPDPRPAVTGTTGYVRMHGRNAQTWYGSDAGRRYDWNYSEQELREWLPRLRAITSRAETSYLFFNNCHMGWAVKNALLMKEILQQQFEAV